MIVFPLIILQFAFLVTLLYQFAISMRLVTVLSTVSIALSIYVANRNEDPAYKLSWIMLILAVPVVGVPLYLIAGNRKVPKKLFNGTMRANKEMDGLLQMDYDLIYEVSTKDSSAADILRYGTLTGVFPVFRYTVS